ncbi:hypothetical protein [Mesobacillus subterraneus]|uniref:Uncharacterized protein n=1 Tax=Mesobacillus subterraneus TaxID=285983 RepID=A0A427TVF8_9BACI|nr:hypothetical protein [Mesobacillus subterraneus]RSD28411.1 hypothetical protein EJA10_04820 [Mesobacillus subterraneus]
MVIQSNMTPEAIVQIWGDTADVFIKHNILIVNKPLETLVESDILPAILDELNATVGSSSGTCVEGG